MPAEQTLPDGTFIDKNGKAWKLVGDTWLEGQPDGKGGFSFVPKGDEAAVATRHATNTQDSLDSSKRNSDFAWRRDLRASQDQVLAGMLGQEMAAGAGFDAAAGQTNPYAFVGGHNASLVPDINALLGLGPAGGQPSAPQAAPSAPWTGENMPVNAAAMAAGQRAGRVPGGETVVPAVAPVAAPVDPRLRPTDPYDAMWNDVNLADQARDPAMAQLNQYRQDVDLLRRSAMGQGPSAAESLQRAALDANRRQMASAGASARGGNIAAALRGAQQAGAQSNLQSANQMAALRAQEQLTAQAQLAGAQSQFAGAANAARNTDIGRATNQGTLSLNRGDLSLRTAQLGVNERDAMLNRALQAWLVNQQLQSGERVSMDTLRTNREIANMSKPREASAAENVFGVVFDTAGKVLPAVASANSGYENPNQARAPQTDYSTTGPRSGATLRSSDF